MHSASVYTNAKVRQSKIYIMYIVHIHKIYIVNSHFQNERHPG